MQLWKRIRRKNNAQTKTTLSPPSATSPPITTSATSIHHPPPPSGLTGPNEEITRDAKVESTTRTEEPIKKQESIDGHPLVPPRNPHWSPFEKPSEVCSTCYFLYLLFYFCSCYKYCDQLMFINRHGSLRKLHGSMRRTLSSLSMSSG